MSNGPDMPPMAGKINPSRAPKIEPNNVPLSGKVVPSPKTPDFIPDSFEKTPTAGKIIPRKKISNKKLAIIGASIAAAVVAGTLIIKKIVNKNTQEQVKNKQDNQIEK